MVNEAVKTEDKSQKDNDKYAAFLYYRLRNEIVILRRFAKNYSLGHLKGRFLEMIKTTEMRFDIVGKEYMHIMRTGGWSKFLIEKMEWLNLDIQFFANDIIKQLEEIKEAKAFRSRKPKQDPDRPNFKTTKDGLKALGEKTYSVVSTIIPDEIRSKFSTKQIQAVNNLCNINNKILEEIDAIRDKFDDHHKWSRVFPLMLKQFADFKIEFPTEFVVLMPWSVNEYELPEKCTESERLFKKLMNVTKKILSELKQIHFNQDLFMDMVPDQIMYSDVKEMVHLPIPKDCPSSDSKDISYPRYHEGFSDNPLIRIIDAHKELLYKVRSVRIAQFRLHKVKHNLWLKNEYLRLARDKYYDPDQAAEEEIKYFSYETWQDEPVTPEQEEQRYNEHFEYYRECKKNDQERRTIKAKRRKESKIHAVKRNKFIEQAWKEAKEEAKQLTLEAMSIYKCKKIRQGEFKLIKVSSNPKLASLNIFKELKKVFAEEAKVADTASAGNTTILEDNKKENIIKDEYNSANDNIIDITIDRNYSKKEELNKKKPHY